MPTPIRRCTCQAAIAVSSRVTKAQVMAAAPMMPSTGTTSRLSETLAASTTDLFATCQLLLPPWRMMLCSMPALDATIMAPLRMTSGTAPDSKPLPKRPRIAVTDDREGSGRTASS